MNVVGRGGEGVQGSGSQLMILASVGYRRRRRCILVPVAFGVEEGGTLRGWWLAAVLFTKGLSWILGS